MIRVTRLVNILTKPPPSPRKLRKTQQKSNFGYLDGQVGLGNGKSTYNPYNPYSDPPASYDPPPKTLNLTCY